MSTGNGAALRFTDYLDPVFCDLLLALVMRDTTFTARVIALVHPWYFSTQAHQAIFEALDGYWKAYKTLPTSSALRVAVSAHAPDPDTRDAYGRVIDRLKAIPDSDLPAAFLETKLVTFCQKAEGAAAVAVAQAQSPNFDLAALAQKFAWILQLPSILGHLGLNLRQQWSRASEHDVREIYKTGFDVLDNAMRGGLREGELCVFLAIAKGGKTMVLSNLGVGLLSMGYRVIHYTLEMSEVDVLKRYLSVLTGVPTNELQQHYPSVRQAVAALDAYTEGNVIIKYFPGKATTLEQLEGHLNLCEADNDGHPLIPIVDYADRLTIPARMEEWRALEEIYTHIRSLAEQHKIPIITASQANTGGYTASQLGPQHISGTTRKGFVLDYLWSVDTSPLDADIGRLRLTCLLNRHDRPHTATYWRADYTSGRIEPISHQDYELMETLHAGEHEHAQHAQT